jgi:thiamine-monophosphate kinase
MPGEFEFIEKIKSRHTLGKIGDDCAILPKDAKTDLLLTADMLVEDIDFRLEWTTPELLGHKALAVSLSDIAAMGGNAKWAMLSLGIPESLWKSAFVDAFYAGWFTLANEFDVELVGGDISRTPDKLVIDSIAGGEVVKGKAIMRSGAKPGDAIYVTGSLGGAAGGLKLLERGDESQHNIQISTANLTARQLKPTPQLLLANMLRSLEIISSMIDVSDGLSSDLFHICQQSNVGARIDAERLPIDVCLQDCFDADESLEMALHGGEDFELLFTADEKNISSLDIGQITCIGTVTANLGIVELTDGQSIRILDPKGYRHF